MLRGRYRASSVAFAALATTFGCTLVYGDPLTPTRANDGAIDGAPDGDASPSSESGEPDGADGGLRVVLGVFRGGAWILDSNANGHEDPEDRTYSFGATGDTPVVGDWTGNGISKLGVVRDGAWKLDTNGDGVFGAGDATFTFGGPGALPVVGRWNDDPRTRVGVFGAITATNGQFSLDMDGDGKFTQPNDRVFAFGLAADLPVAGSWSGSGISAVGVVRPETASGALSFSLDLDGSNTYDPPRELAFTFGRVGDTPVVGDWNGDGRAKIGVFRDGTWLLDSDGDRRFDPTLDQERHFGRSGDIPVVFER